MAAADGELSADVCKSGVFAAADINSKFDEDADDLG